MENSPESAWVLEKVVIGGLTRLYEGITTVGRSAACTITISSDFVSRTHAEFQVTPGSEDIHIRDLGSTNGIFVNDLQFNRTACRLQVGDRIGIGVSVDDEQISPDGKYPMFVVRRVPLCEEKNVLDQPAEVPQEDAEKLDAPIIAPSPTLSVSDDDQPDDKVYDSDDNEDDFVQPLGYQILELEKSIPAAIPPADIPKRNIISENIQSIFGDFNSEVLSNLSKDTRAIAEASISKYIPVATDEDNVICISSDEECDANRREIAKSPELFCDSFNNDEDAINAEKEKAIIVEGTSKNLVTKIPIFKRTNEQDPVATSLKVEDVDENEEEEELYLTQKAYDDLRDELSDPDNETAADYKVDDQGTLIMAPIKQEKLSQSNDDIINLDDDDDEYDELLESKVNDWTFKLLSQSFSNSFNSSQIYEDDVDNAPAVTTEGIFINIDDIDEDDSSGGDQIVKIEQDTDEPIEEGPRVSSLITPSPSEKEEEEQAELAERTNAEDITESPLIRQWKRSSSKKFLFSSSSSEEDNREGGKANKTSLSSSKMNHEKSVYARKLSYDEEIPQKKPRLGSKSEENEKEEMHLQQQSSSSLKTYSRKSSEKSDISKPGHTVEDEFDKLKNEKQIRRPSGSYKCTTERSNSKDNAGGSTFYRRSSSAADEATSKPCKSAAVARRKSLSNQSFVEEKEMDDFDEPKKPEPPAHTTLTKMIRGPPEIINPPQLPINRGKLRGVSAVQTRCIENIKAIQCQKDLKRKWVEKPSIAKRKEQAKCKAIKEDRKQKLKELADKKNADIKITKENVSTNKNESKKTVTEKLKVKVTPFNRGAFLTEDTPNTGIRPYRIPKNSTKPGRISSTSNKSTSAPKASSSKSVTSTKATDEGKSSTEVSTNFSMELLKVDTVLQNVCKPSVSTAQRSRQKSTDVSTEQKECAPPRRKNKKLTFDAMEQHFEETTRLQESKVNLPKESSMKSPIAQQKKKKTVRFNDVPEIRYIEPVFSATRKVYNKQMSTFNERRNYIRRRFPVVDHTEELLSDVLSWSQAWLDNRRTLLNMDGYIGMVFPMTNQFTSIDNYKSTVFPLLKIEYLSHLERHMQQSYSRPGNKVRIDYFTQHKDRELIFAKCSTLTKKSELGVTDLVLIDIVAGSTKSQCFGYIGNIRKGDSFSCITIEVGKNTFPKDNIENGAQVTIRRIIESIRVYFGSFNAVHQLEKAPLYNKILNPLELLNVKTNRRPLIQYKGCDPLNAEQQEVLLKTYAKAIDEGNPNISLIKGPPGTGKSRLITNLALQLLYGNEVRMLDKKILICAQSNMAVDVIAQKLLHIQKKLSARAPKYEVIRFGKYEKIHKDVKDITLTKLIQRDHKARLLEMNASHEQITMGENLINEILKLEARVAELQKENLKDVRQDELVEMQKSLALKKKFQNQSLGPDDEQQLFRLYLENAHIVCATLSSCVKLSNYVNYFDVCIIDEATQCIEPWTIMPLKFGTSSLILVGDIQQLPATVISQKAKDYGLGTSLFTRIQNCLENSGDLSPILSLNTQYRMHPEICKWPNMYFYKNQLVNAPNTEEFKSQIKPFSILNLEYTQNDQCYNGQIANDLEAEFVAKLVKTMNLYIPNKFCSYGVITPYAQHREKLEILIKSSGLSNIIVNTIDSYQGIEKDVIIISNARTRGVGFLANYQRLNVALTRPKKCLILCGNFKNLESVPSWASLLANARERGLFHDISIADTTDIDKNVIDKMKIKR